MKNAKLITATFIVAIAILTVDGCKKNPLPTSIMLTNITAGNVDLAGSGATGVDPSASIIATFTFYIDVSSASTSNIFLIPTSDSIRTNISIATSENKVTIMPVDPMKGNTEYALHLGNKIRSNFGLYYAGSIITFTTK